MAHILSQTLTFPTKLSHENLLYKFIMKVSQASLILKITQFRENLKGKIIADEVELFKRFICYYSQ